MINLIYNIFFWKKLYYLGFLEGYEKAKECYEKVGKTINTDEAVDYLFKDIEQYKEFYKKGYLQGIRCFVYLFLKIKI